MTTNPDQPQLPPQESPSPHDKQRDRAWRLGRIGHLPELLATLQNTATSQKDVVAVLVELMLMQHGVYPRPAASEHTPVTRAPEHTAQPPEHTAHAPTTHAHTSKWGDKGEHR